MAYVASNLSEKWPYNNILIKVNGVLKTWPVFIAANEKPRTTTEDPKFSSILNRTTHPHQQQQQRQQLQKL